MEPDAYLLFKEAWWLWWASRPLWNIFVLTTWVVWSCPIKDILIVLISSPLYFFWLDLHFCHLMLAPGVRITFWAETSKVIIAVLHISWRILIVQVILLERRFSRQYFHHLTWCHAESSSDVLTCFIYLVIRVCLILLFFQMKHGCHTLLFECLVVLLEYNLDFSGITRIQLKTFLVINKRKLLFDLWLLSNGLIYHYSKWTFWTHNWLFDNINSTYVWHISIVITYLPELLYGWYHCRIALHLYLVIVRELPCQHHFPLKKFIYLYKKRHAFIVMLIFNRNLPLFKLLWLISFSEVLL